MYNIIFIFSKRIASLIRPKEWTTGLEWPCVCVKLTLNFYVVVQIDSDIATKSSVFEYYYFWIESWFYLIANFYH